MRKFNGTENEFELNGVTYITQPQGNCRGCAFDPDMNCGALKRPPCRRSERADGLAVIFIRKPATSESQPAMTSTPTPAPTTAKPLDFSKPVIAGDGTPVRILCTDSGIPDYPVVGICGEDVMTWTLEGRYNITCREHHLDLIQAPQPRKHAELIKRWADDDSMRIKTRHGNDLWEETRWPSFSNDWDYEEILPGDPLY